MAKCVTCFQPEAQCCCCAPKRTGAVWVMPDGTRYLDREVAAGIVLMLGIVLFLVVAAFSAFTR